MLFLLCDLTAPKDHNIARCVCVSVRAYVMTHSLLRWVTFPFICSSVSVLRSMQFRPFSSSCRASSASFRRCSSSVRDSISAWGKYQLNKKMRELLVSRG